MRLTSPCIPRWTQFVFLSHPSRLLLHQHIPETRHGIPRCMASSAGCCGRPDNNWNAGKPDHHGVCSLQWLDSTYCHFSGGSIELESRGCVGFAHWSCCCRRDNHGLLTDACSFEFANPTTTSVLQPVPDWSAGAFGGQERVLVVPGRLLVCSYHRTDVAESHIFLGGESLVRLSRSKVQPKTKVVVPAYGMLCRA